MCIPNSLTTTSHFFSFRCSLASNALRAFGRQYQYGLEATTTMIKWVSVLRPSSDTTDYWTEPRADHLRPHWSFAGVSIMIWAHFVLAVETDDCVSSSGCWFSKPWSHTEIFWSVQFLSLLVVVTVIPFINFSCCEWSLSQWLQTYVDICMYTPSTVQSTFITITC